jgi:hypothetical protein
MATTAVGNPYVESSDLVANYPGVSETLAERIDVVGVNPFADAAARTTAIPSPVEGQMSSLADTDSVERYDGAAWVSVGRESASATVATSQSTTSTSFTDLATVGPAVTLTTGTKALVIVTCWLVQTTTGASAYASPAVSGASTVAASDATSLRVGAASGGTYQPQLRASSAEIFTGLTAGSNTFTIKYKTNGSSSLFVYRNISVIDMGS